MLGPSFKEYIINRYGLYNVVSSAFKYVHCDLIFVFLVPHNHTNYGVNFCEYILWAFQCRWIYQNV
jgi:hypothetical protein